MNRVFALLLMSSSAVGLSVGWLLKQGSPRLWARAESLTPAWPALVAANGIVEGRQPEAALRPETVGVIAAVHVVEGQMVRRGELLVELHSESQQAQVLLAQGEIGVARAELERLRNGERLERIRAAKADEEARGAQVRQAEAEWERARGLRAGQAISPQELDALQCRVERARQEHEQARQERLLREAPPRVEDVAAAESRLSAAQARLALARAELAKTRLTAPADGTVLRRFAEPGETAGPASDRPLLLLADLTRRRVRAFVEELDCLRARPGQRATATVDGLPGREFAGRLTEVLPRMGRRAPQSDRPGEYHDLHFREVLLDLEGADELPLNLRVQVRFLPD